MLPVMFKNPYDKMIQNQLSIFYSAFYSKNKSMLQIPLSLLNWGYLDLS